MLTTVTTILVVLTLVFGGTGVTVAAAQDSQPNQALYSVKLATEDARLAMNGAPEDALGLMLQFTHQRMEELQAMVRAGESVPEPFMQRFQHQWQEAVRLANGLGDEVERTQAMEQVRTQLMLQEQTMLMLRQNNPGNADPALEQLMNMLQTRRRQVENELEPPAMMQNRQKLGAPGEDEQQPGPGPNEEPGSGVPVGPGGPQGQNDEPGGPQLGPNEQPGGPHGPNGEPVGPQGPVMEPGGPNEDPGGSGSVNGPDMENGQNGQTDGDQTSESGGGSNSGGSDSDHGGGGQVDGGSDNGGSNGGGNGGK